MKKIVLGVLIVLVVVVVAFFAVLLGDAFLFEQAADVTNASFAAEDGTTLIGYLAQPEGEGPFPAVIMVHEWWGLNAEIRALADILAQQGYVVLAPDTYRGRTATTVPGALFLRISVPEARVDADMMSAYAYLTTQANVDNARVGVMGFCYGGGVALRHGVQNAAIAATINLYGDMIFDTPGFGALLENDRPVLGIFGAVDAQIPVAEVEQFEQALVTAGIPHEVTIYPGVGHAFVNPHSIAQAGAAQEAWAQILAFLEANVKNPA
ncbi:MAG: dienelactone hydrolase family protein [Chloroflexi bacterium]|nr:dienelactone hydrolase family protein [Chloroflexota bacterium]